MQNQWQSSDDRFDDQEGVSYPQRVIGAYTKGAQQYEIYQNTPRTPPAPDPNAPVREPWGFRGNRYDQLGDIQDRYDDASHPQGAEAYMGFPGQSPTGMHPQSYQQQWHPSQFQPNSSDPSQRNYTLSNSQHQNPAGYSQEFLSERRLLLPQTAPERRQVHQDPYGHYQADELSDDVYRLSVLDPGHATRAERHVHDPTRREYDSNARHPRDGTMPRARHRTAKSGHRRDIPTDRQYSNDRPELDPRYGYQGNGYFKEGRVFSVIWHENAGSSSHCPTHGSSETGRLTRGKFGQWIYTSPRRMVVIRTFRDYSLCLGIFTYGRLGVAKASVDPSTHAVIHDTNSIPFTKQEEPKMTKGPLAMVLKSPDMKLDPMSRLNFGKIYTVEHNVKVMPIGKIESESMPKLKRYSRDVMETKAE